MTHVMDFRKELSAELLDGFYVNGQWVTPKTSQRLTLISPVTEQKVL